MYSEAFNLLVSNARAEVFIYSDHLASKDWDNEECYQCLSEFLRRSRKSHCQIAIRNVEKFIKDDHSFLRLARRLPSSLSILVADELHYHSNEEFILNDVGQMLYKPQADLNRYFHYDMSDSRTREKQTLFPKIWQYAKNDPHLREFRL